MANGHADGTILIDTEISSDGFETGSHELEAAVRRMSASVKDLGTSARTSLQSQVESFAKLNAQYSAQAKKIDTLKAKADEYANKKAPTQEYIEVQAQIDRATQKMDSLIARQEKFKATGGNVNTRGYKAMQYEVDQLGEEIQYATGELRELEATGRAFAPGTGLDSYKRTMSQIAAEEEKLVGINKKLSASYSSIKQKVDSYNSAVAKTANSNRKAASSTDRFNQSLDKTKKSSSGASLGLGKMLKMTLLFNIIFKAITAVTGAIKDGFTNLASYSNETNRSLSMLQSSTSRLKNSLATAFAPILNTIAPILSKFIDMLSTAATYVSMFFAALSGKSTYTRAIAVQESFASSQEDVASGASDAADSMNDAADAAERYLSPLDDLNRFSDNTTSGSGSSGSPSGGSGGGSGSAPLFEEVEIDNGFLKALDSVIEKLKAVRDIFMDGFWDGLGDYKPLIEELKSDLSSIGKHLTEIFTDQNVQAAAKRFAVSFIENLGRIVGSFASIGLAIAVNIVGGFESYLSQNKNRIKDWLVSIFNVGAEIMDIIGGTAKDFAEVFSAVFSSQTAQDITGDIIGIFATAFGLVSELALKAFRDIANLITQPFRDNKEAIKQALLETLEPIRTITQAIEDFVQHVADKVMELYDAHVKPFIDSLTNGISEIVKAFVSAYRTYIVPVLDGIAAKFKEVMEGPVGEAFNSFIGFVGKLVDALKILWETVLLPLLIWLVETVMPDVAVVVGFLGELALDLLAVIGDVTSGIFDALGGLIDFLVGVFTGDWDKAFSGLKQIGEGFQKAINSIFDFIRVYVFEKFGSFLNGIFKTDWTKAFGIFGEVLNGFFSAVKTIWNGIKTVFDGVVQFINGVFSGNWRQAWEGIKTIFKGIWDSLVGVVKIPVNGIISLINALLSIVERAQNWIASALSFNISLPGWLEQLTGYSSFGISVGKVSIPRIPYLASGAVIPPNAPFMAMLGDQKNGTNIETPLATMIDAFNRALDGRGGSGGGTNVSVEIKGRTLLDVVIEEARAKQSQNGKNVFDLDRI